MKQYIKLYILLLLGVALNASPTNATQLYSVQVDAVFSPDLAIYAHLTQYGFLHTQTTDTGLRRILLGSYKSAAQAEQVRQKVLENGYTNALVQTTDISSFTNVYCIQLGMYKYTSGLIWTKYGVLNDLRVEATNGRVKLFSGVFYNKKEAQNYREKVASHGFTSAFVTSVNEGALLHPTEYNFRPEPEEESIVSGEAPPVQASPISAPTPSRPPTPTVSSSSLEELYNSELYLKLSEQERMNVSIIDGKLFIKQNNQFIALTQYTPGEPMTKPASTTSPTSTKEIPASKTVTKAMSEVERIFSNYNNTPPPPSKPSSTANSKDKMVSAVKSRTNAEPAPTRGMLPPAKGNSSTVLNDFRIQLGAVRSFNPLQFAPLDHLGTFSVEPIGNQGAKRVILGNFASLSEAREVQVEVIAQGYQHATIFIYENGRRVGKIN